MNFSRISLILLHLLSGYTAGDRGEDPEFFEEVIHVLWELSKRRGNEVLGKTFARR